MPQDYCGRSPEFNRPYGNLTDLNQTRLILDAVGDEALQNIANDFLELLGTSCAIYEKNGDYALGIVSSGWCQLLDKASYLLCKTDDPKKALTNKNWYCHQCCWLNSAQPCINKGESIDVECAGGLRLFAVPIQAGDKVVGAINFGYGQCPEDPKSIAKLAKKFKVTPQQLKAAAKEHPRVSNEIVEEARRWLRNAAQLIGLIVERNQAQQAARQADERYRLLFETSSQGVLFFNENGVVVEANPAACRILGRSLEDFARETQSGSVDAVDEKGRPVPLEQLPPMRALREARRISGEVIGLYNPKDKKTHWIQGEVVPIVEEGQTQPSTLYTVFSDVTEQKHAAEALKSSEKRLRLSLKAANQGLYDLDLRTGNAVVSPEYATMLGFDPNTFQETNTKWLERLHPEDRPHIEAAYRAYVAGETPEYSVEFRQRMRTGEWKWIWSLGKIVERDPDGKPLRMMGTHTDIDDRKAAEEEQRHAEEQMRHVQKLESLGVLAGGIAHDFNNLLMSVLGYADLALDDLGPTHPVQSYVKSIKAASQRATELCRQMLAYAGKGRFVLEKINLSQIVQEMGRILQVSVSKNTTLKYELSKDLPLVEADISQVRQVIMNLITNASEALSDTPGWVSVKTGFMTCDKNYLKKLFLTEDLREGPYAFIEVRDNGIGMNEDTQKRIFEPFFTTKFTGRGLGLAATLGIMRGHHGGIELMSQPNEGASFKVLFPVVEGKAAKRRDRIQRADQWSGSGKVLLVDDEPDVNMVAAQMLRRIGFEVVSAMDGIEAVQRFQEDPDSFVCILLDLTMPRMGGEETYNELRKLKNDAPIILSSGYNEQEVSQRFAGKGHAGFIQKPYTLAGLRKAFQGVLG